MFGRLWMRYCALTDYIKACISTVIWLFLPCLIGGCDSTWWGWESVTCSTNHRLYSSMSAKWELSKYLPLLPPCKNKIPDGPVILSQSLIDWTIRLVCWRPPPQTPPPPWKMFPASLQRTLNQTRQAQNSPGSFRSSSLVTLPNPEQSFETLLLIEGLLENFRLL